MSTRSIATLALVCMAALPGRAQVSGDVSGVWTSGSLVTVVGDLRVPPGQELTVEPGVTIAFTGPYGLLVEGKLVAVGTVGSEILFTRAQPTEASRWDGIHFSGADDASLLERCKIEWVKRDGEQYYEVRGGGVAIEDCSPTVRLCELNDNYARNAARNGAGGGIFVGASSSSLIERNHVHDNLSDSGGGICVSGLGGRVTVRGNLIERNAVKSSGGGIYVGANAHISNNVVRDNTSSGMFGGGGITTWNSGGPSFVYGNLIAGNTCTGGPGGGIYSRYSGLVYMHNTIVDNLATTGGGIYVITADLLYPVVDGCIVWGNQASTGTGASIYVEPQVPGSITVRRCDVEGGWPGENLNVYPAFVDPAAGDYHLGPRSPCRDRASTALPDAMPFDIDGDPRVIGRRADIGADEFATAAGDR